MRAIVALAGAFLAMGCTANLDTREVALTQAKVIGEPQDCIRRSDITHTRIRNDKVIDFVVRGRRVYRNELPYSCSGLATADRFRYSPATSQLCSVETITVITTDGSPGPTCGLGKFQLVELPFKG